MEQQRLDADKKVWRVVEGLRELRQAAGKAQADVAAALSIKQPSVSKIESQADMYLSTLRSYVQAIGGDLELVVRLPARPAIHLQNLGSIGAGISAAKADHSGRTKGVIQQRASPRQVDSCQHRKGNMER